MKSTGSAVSRKRARPQGVSGKPTNVKTFAKRTNNKKGNKLCLNIPKER